MSTVNTVDLKKKNWIVPFLRQVATSFDVEHVRARFEALGELEEGERFEAWLIESLVMRGMLVGTPLAEAPKPEGQHNREAGYLFTLLTHQVEMLFELRLLHGFGHDQLSDQLHVLMALAADAGEYDAAELFYELAQEDWGLSESPRRDLLTKKMGSGVRALGSILKTIHLQDREQPLFGLPFHRLLSYSYTCQLMGVADCLLREGGRVDEVAVERARARGYMQRVHLIEAVLALAAVDGTLSRVEKRLVESVIAMANVGADEAKMIWSAIDSPVTPGDLGCLLPDSRTRRFLFEQLLLHAYLEGELGEEEARFIDDLAEAFAIEQSERLVYEAEALQLLEATPELVDASRFKGLVRRFRTRLDEQIEGLVVLNIARITMEIRETGELGQLLLKRTHGQLSVEEEEKIRLQILDICKTVPALAVFAAPGGTLLLPIVMRLLPFDLMPSAFNEKDEAL